MALVHGTISSVITSWVIPQLLRKNLWAIRGLRGVSAPSSAAGLVATLDTKAVTCAQHPGLSVIAPNFGGEHWGLTCCDLSCPCSTTGHFDTVSLSPYVVGGLHRLCYWRASSVINSSERVAIAFYCSSALDLKQCLSNEKLPMRYGNISLAKLLFSKSGFCVNIKPFIYHESISANIPSSYFNVICKNMYFSLVPIWRGARSFRSCLMR